MAGVNGVGSTSTTPKVVAPEDTGFNGLKSEDFLKLLITQLQNQDPSNPLDSNQLLSQISELRGLQASIELQTALKGLTLSQQLNSSTDFIGKTVTGSVGQELVTGEVTGVQVREGNAFLRVNGKEMELKNVQTVVP